MKYSFDSRVRFSETGEDRKLTLNGIINYFQDCSTFHSESLGVGMDYLEGKHQAWVLLTWHVVVERYPKLCEKIKVSTWPYSFKRFLGGRNYTMEDEQGNRIAYANTLWSFLDLNTGHPVNVDEKQEKAYELEEKLDMEYTSRKIRIPALCDQCEPFTVKIHHLDTNHHVNNGQYVLMAAQYLPEDFIIGEMRAEYKKQAVLHDTIIPRVHEEAGIYTVVLDSLSQGPYAVIEFKNRGIV